MRGGRNGGASPSDRQDAVANRGLKVPVGDGKAISADNRSTMLKQINAHAAMQPQSSCLRTGSLARGQHSMSSVGMTLAAASCIPFASKPMAVAPAMGNIAMDAATSSERRLRPRLFLQNFDTPGIAERGRQAVK